MWKEQVININDGELINGELEPLEINLSVASVIMLALVASIGYLKCPLIK